MKASARLIKAFIALIVSGILCISVCLAWFAQNEKIDANGMQSEIHDGNITEFRISAYYLVKDEDDASLFTIGQKFASNSAIKMPEYGGLDGTKTTAILLEFSYACKEKTFTIKADCNEKYGFDGQTPVNDTFECFLSDAVEIFKTVTVTKSGGAVVGGTATVGAAGETFTYEENETVDGETVKVIKKQSLVLADDIASGEGAFYCIIDYSEDNITELYALAADNGGGISSAINFIFGTQSEKDIVFYMQETVQGA